METLLSPVEDKKCLTELSNVSYIYTIDPQFSKVFQGNSGTKTIKDQALTQRNTVFLLQFNPEMLM